MRYGSEWVTHKATGVVGAGIAKALYRGHKAQERAKLWEGEKWQCSLSLAGSLRLAGGGEELGIDEAQDRGKRKPQQGEGGIHVLLG